MAGVFVQAKTGTGTVGTSLVVTFDSSTAGGNLIFVGAANDGGSADVVTSITDNKSNTYTFIAGASQYSRHGEGWYAKNISGGASHAVTINFTGNAAFVGQILEYSGLDTTAPLDASGSGFGDSTTVTFNIITTNADDTIVGFVYGTGAAWTPGSGYTERSDANNGATEDKNVASTGTYAVNWTNTGVVWVAEGAAFKAAGGAATVVQDLIQPGFIAFPR